MNAKELQERTKAFALRIVRMVSALPRSTVGNVLGNQVLRSGTSVGAQYREACRSRSTAEFTSKMESSLQELVVYQVHFDRLLGWQLYCHPRVRQCNCRTNEPVIFGLANH
jgi:four helix bundle protein